MSKNQVLIAAAFGILIALVIMFITSLHSPDNAVLQNEAIQAETEILQTGSYELSPGTPSDTELPVESIAEYTVEAEPEKKPARKAKPAETEPADPGYDTVDPGIVKQPPTSPPADELRQMQKRGIVAY